MKIISALFFAAAIPVAAQTPEVPHKMEFAGITLTIRDDARREIQKDVDALTQSPRHYNIKAERAKTYFPIIEKIFAEEQVPDDFKYLALQESALIADAVSVSNAVGFWQFKDFTAMEMGLRVDKQIDERLNIVSSSRAAARYIKKNNTFFDNWIYALQAYQMGAGGVLKTVKDNQPGATRMEITSHTYWYVKKYLAHKVAYEPGVKGKGITEVLTLETNNGKSLSELAREVSVDETTLRDYNKWTKSGNIPTDRTYVVLIPVSGRTDITLPETVVAKDMKVQSPGLSSASALASTAVKKKINGIYTIQAVNGESAAALASRAGVELSKFLKWNDLASGESLVAGNLYFLGKKRGRAMDNFHKVAAGENLWSISQKYGVQIKKLRKYNRLGNEGEVSAGTMLWLASTRPKSDEANTKVENAVTVSPEDTFNWSTGESNPSAEVKESVVTVKPIKQQEPVIVLETPIEAVQKPSDSLKILQESPMTQSTLTDTLSITVEIPPLKRTTHEVKAGETLYAIAKLYNIGVMDLVNWNDLDLQQGIKPGQVLKLSERETPKSESVAVKQTQEVVHEVKSSDTLYGIARQYGVTIKEIMDWNEKKDFSLAVGEKLKIHHRQ